jgi:hypothetical protein
MHSHDATAGCARYSVKKEVLELRPSWFNWRRRSSPIHICQRQLSAMEESMSHVSRITLGIGAPLALAALLACITPAGAFWHKCNGPCQNGVSMNGIAVNGIAVNGVSMNGLSSTGSALADLNGVAVEAVIIPDAATR